MDSNILNLESIKTVLGNLKITPDTEPLIKKLIKDYIAVNPSILTECIEERGLYQVFFRGRDTYSCNKKDKNDTAEIMTYIQTFATMQEANEWILKFGSKIVTEEEDNYNKPIVLTVIYCKNNEYQGHAGEDPAHLCYISGKDYPTYAFSKRGYKMLLKEHRKIYRGEWCVSIIPYWIRYINENGIVKYGCDLEHIKKIDSRLTYRDGDIRKEENIKEFEEFIKNPINYIYNKEKK
jgi:hypothetical protein